MLVTPRAEFAFLVTFSDPRVGQQWHLKLLGDINTIWNEYSGAGVTVGLYDDGLQYDHPDLNDNYDPSLHFSYGGEVYDPYPINLAPGADADGHGTAVAGIIAGEAGNGLGGVGVAWGATLTAVNLLEDPRFHGGTPLTDERELAAYRHAASFDIMSNSWGYDAYGFFDFLNRADENSFGSATEDAFGYAVENGRGGLGTLIVKSAGNDAANANGEGINGSRFVIDVAALNAAGHVQSYSNYGTNILVSAGAAAVTTDLLGVNGYNTATGTTGDYASDFGGTSAAAPVVTGVIALMLEANQNLGWRDVREILATSAALTGSVVTGNQDYEVSGTYFQSSAQWNAVTRTHYQSFDTWNDGGRGYSLDTGLVGWMPMQQCEWLRPGRSSMTRKHPQTRNLYLSGCRMRGH
jgi:subtilisin family serine protease